MDKPTEPVLPTAKDIEFMFDEGPRERLEHLHELIFGEVWETDLATGGSTLLRHEAKCVDDDCPFVLGIYEGGA